MQVYAVEGKEAITYLVAGPITDSKPLSELLVVFQEKHFCVSVPSRSSMANVTDWEKCIMIFCASLSYFEASICGLYASFWLCKGCLEINSVFCLLHVRLKPPPADPETFTRLLLQSWKVANHSTFACSPSPEKCKLAQVLMLAQELFPFQFRRYFLSNKLICQMFPVFCIDAALQASPSSWCWK